MNLLIRRISAYTAPDVLLGVFATPDDADAAKAHYLRVREADSAADPWGIQGYRDPGPIGPDLEVVRLPGDFPPGATVVAVSNHSDGFGQERRTLDSLHATAGAAQLRIDELDAADDEGDPFPHYAVADTVVVGRLHSDAREDQPVATWQQKPGRAVSPAGVPRRPLEDGRLAAAIRAGDLDAVLALIDAGADADAPDGPNWPPLQQAIEHQRAEIARRLIAAGADVNRDWGGGWTALAHAIDIEGDAAWQARYETGHESTELTALLLAAGAVPTPRAFKVAEGYGNLKALALLRRAGPT